MKQRRWFGMIWINLLWLFSCSNGTPPDARQADSGVRSNEALAQSGSKASEAQFVDVAQAAGVSFAYFNGGTGRYFFNEIIGGGGALFDMDNDGDLDLFLVQGALLADSQADAMIAFEGSWPPRDRLFRNEGLDKNGVPQFTDVTAKSGIEGTGYGQGVATGDVDNDGDVDLYVTHWGQNQLYVNQGDGQFIRQTELSGTGDPSWGVSAAFVDVDGDGWLDLYVGNYAEYQLEGHQPCRAGALDYCHPKRYPAAVDKLYRNRGDGTFEDISQRVGLSTAFGRALGVVAADFDQNGALDIYVANDASANQLWMNRGNFQFEEVAMLAGAALNETGQPEGSMGVDAADFDGDGDEDLFMTHIRSETNTIYANQGNGMFNDTTVMTGLGVTSLPYTGFGTAWFDYDLDGWLDLFVANGAVSRDGLAGRVNEAFPFDQRNQLFHNEAGRFVDISAEAGPGLQASQVSRGAIFGDLDNDGDADVVVINNSGPVQILQNQTATDNHWLGLQLWVPEHRRDAYGARVLVALPDGRALWRRVRADASYAGANDPRLQIGIGSVKQSLDVVVLWPNGDRETFTQLAIDQYHKLEKGSGNASSR